ncbi:MAG: ORF6N domain-containing protein [Xanthomonadaceae bacterium]|nr:ORF6N domain-containing protein [Xanthomonadaceae bacterium]
MNKAPTDNPSERIENLIQTIRDQRVTVDVDLARLYGVKTKALNQAIKRNFERFPSDFMFRLTEIEKSEVVTICDHLKKIKYSNKLPYAFTEYGAIMAANVLNSQKALHTSVFVVRAFIQLREFVKTHQQFVSKLNELERRLEGHDSVIRSLISTIREMTDPVLFEMRRKIVLRD